MRSDAMVRGLAAFGGVCVCSAGAVAQPNANVVAETVKLIASNGQPDDRFGRSIAIENETVIVGAPFVSRGFFERGAGAAYVFDASTGQEVRDIIAFDAETDDAFGVAVAINDGRAFVGASEQDREGDFAGATYVYNNAGSSFDQFLLPTSLFPQGPVGSFMGITIDADDEFAVVGAPGDVDITNGGGGAMYIYETDTLALVAKVFSSDQAFADNFGTKVAVSGSLAVGTTPFDDDLGTSSGSVYIFNAHTGDELRKIIAPDGEAGDFFGLSVAIEGEVLAVGAPFDDDLGTSSGSVSLFNANTGDFLRKIIAPDGQPGDRFGFAVALSDDRLIVGAPNNDAAGNSAGAAYVFDPATGIQLGRLIPSDLGQSSTLGGAVAISGDLVAVAAEGDGDNGPLAGAAYVFDIASIAAACNPADLAAPLGFLDLADVDAFITAFTSGDGAADIAPPLEFIDLSDVDAFIAAFQAGCP